MKIQVDLNLPFDVNANEVDLPLSEESIKATNARDSLLDFTTYTKPDYQVNWHHRHLCQKLDDFISGKIKRLMVFAPPRTGKSELVSRRLPAYIFGKDPNASIISASYSSDLASRMNRDVQKIIDSEAYQRVFPETRLWGKNIRTVANGASLRNSEIFEIVDHNGIYKSSGVGGAITGLGGKFLICDDPIKNSEEAESKVYRDKIWDWYTTTFYTRLEKDAGLLVTLTRWHHDDLAGRLLKKMQEDKEADQFEIVCFPMIREDEDDGRCYDPRKRNDVLWPDKYPEKEVRKIKRNLGTKNFQSLHQQNPTAASGNLFKRTWWKHYRTLPATWDMFTTSWDFTFKDTKKSDYVVGQAWMKLGAYHYLVDQIRDQMNFSEMLKAMITFCSKYPYANQHLVEDKANGPAIIDMIHQKIPGVIAINPKESKYARASSVSPLVEAGNVFLPMIDSVPWVGEYIEELCGFDQMAHDDQVDATSQYLKRMQEGYDWLDGIDAPTELPPPMSADLMEKLGWELKTSDPEDKWEDEEI